ncbi:MAG: hypothetical protein ABIF71_06675 [Planctomycetota bacterium]
MHDRDLWQQLVAIAEKTPVIDAHTHVQDDITGFDEAKARGNLASTQAAVNRPSAVVVAEGLKRGRMARRTMTDSAHGLFYSWFAQVAEGYGGRLDEALKRVGNNSDQERRAAAKFMLGELWDSRYSEYGEWIRFMFRLYKGRFPDPGGKCFGTFWRQPGA